MARIAEKSAVVLGYLILAGTVIWIIKDQPVVAHTIATIVIGLVTSVATVIVFLHPMIENSNSSGKWKFSTWEVLGFCITAIAIEYGGLRLADLYHQYFLDWSFLWP